MLRFIHLSSISADLAGRGEKRSDENTFFKRKNPILGGHIQRYL